MFLFVFLLLAGAAPFWESKAPEEWTDMELEQLLKASPWARRLETTIPGAETPRVKVGPVHVFLASAHPIQMAEAELRKRQEGAAEEPEEDEFREFLAENPGRYIVLAVRPRRPRMLEDEGEVERMEKRSALEIGGRKFRVVGHFPPTDVDPYLRLVFEKNVGPGDAALRFDLYLPGVPKPFRRIEFSVKEMEFQGHPDF